MNIECILHMLLRKAVQIEGHCLSNLATQAQLWSIFLYCTMTQNSVQYLSNFCLVPVSYYFIKKCQANDIVFQAFSFDYLPCLLSINFVLETALVTKNKMVRPFMLAFHSAYGLMERQAFPNNYTTTGGSTVIQELRQGNLTQF